MNPSNLFSSQMSVVKLTEQVPLQNNLCKIILIGINKIVFKIHICNIHHLTSIHFGLKRSMVNVTGQG